ncbi:MAG: nucleotidyltransferase domain-containing protein, partial [Micropepsaceae bacterium]
HSGGMNPKREALADSLAALAGKGSADSVKLKTAALPLLKHALAEGRAQARTYLESGGTGLGTAKMLSASTDALIEALYRFTVEHVFTAQNPTDSEHIAVVAVGGYGRGTLAPGSDVDLLFLLPFKQTAWGECVVEFVLHLLWDLGLKVGHATRSIDECVRLAKADHTIRTAILETRFLCGQESLFDRLKVTFAKDVVTGSGRSFVEAKLDERARRHKGHGESRYLVEPNVKDGKGGLRDLHTLFWIAKYLHRVEDTSELVNTGLFTVDEFKAFADAEEFLWLVRCHMHFLAGRAEERLAHILRGAGSAEPKALAGVRPHYHWRRPQACGRRRVFH